jgi:hypothetical protein
MDIEKVFMRVVIFIIIAYLVYRLTQPKDNYLENYMNAIDKEQKEYIKYTETHLSNKDQSLKDLYQGYSGEGHNQSEWKDMNLHQCVDRCNKLTGCVGFSRENVNDNEKASCYPKSILSKCHSSRKGNFNQRQKSLNYNTYIKANIGNQLTKCIGDESVTIGRDIFLKSYAYPNKFIGLKNNKVEMISKGPNQVGLFIYCKFKVEVGKEGSGTLSFRHIESGKYLCRTKKDLISCVKLNSSTDMKQRCSFQLHDGLSNQIILKCLPVQGEKLSRYVCLDRNAKYLKAVTQMELNKSNNKFMEKLTFDLVDFLTDNTIVESKEQFGDLKKNRNKRRENFNDNQPNIEEDRLEMYQYLNSGIDLTTFQEEQEENAEQNQISIGQYRSLSDIDNHFNRTLDGKKNEIEGDNGETTFKKLRDINDNLYKESQGIEKQRKNLENKIQKCTSNIDNMKLRDMSRDYNYLKSLLKQTDTPTSDNPPKAIQQLIEDQPEAVVLN